jgi:hypothetical protein
MPGVPDAGATLPSKQSEGSNDRSGLARGERDDHLGGEYQIGEVYARSAIVIRVSGSGWMPKRAAS